MVGSGPHQASPHQSESAGSQRQDTFLNLERERDREKHREGSVCTIHTSKSHSRVGSHVSQRQDSNKAMQQEIDDLKKKLCHAQQNWSPSSSDMSSNDEGDDNYRQRSRTPPSETFSYKEEQRYKHKRSKSPSRKGLGNDAISKALNQISKSSFTRKVEGAKLPQQFHQPTFTIYDGRTDPVEHMSQFNQRTAVHSKNEALMCKVFPSNLELVVMRWFDVLRSNSISSFK